MALVPFKAGGKAASHRETKTNPMPRKMSGKSSPMKAFGVGSDLGGSNPGGHPPFDRALTSDTPERNTARLSRQAQGRLVE